MPSLGPMAHRRQIPAERLHPLGPQACERGLPSEAGQKGRHVTVTGLRGSCMKAATIMTDVSTTNEGHVGHQTAAW